MSHNIQVADIQRIAADTRLTLEAKAILLYLVTRGPEYRLTIPDLVALSAGSHIPSRSKTVYSRLKELIAVGYVTRTIIQRGAKYVVHVNPINVATDAPAKIVEAA